MSYDNQYYIYGILDVCGLIEKLYENNPRAGKKTVMSLLEVTKRDYQLLKENGSILTGIRVSPENICVGLYDVYKLEEKRKRA